jgi:5-methylcytosine-specific restriction enzyme subunit McrC
MIDRVECRYDEYLTDIVENRILLAALANCASRVRHPGIAMKVRRLLAIFSEVCSLEELDLRLVRSTLVYNRMNEHYREPHALAFLLLDGLGVSDIFASASQRCFAFLLDMNRLFEDFVTRWLGESLPSYGLRTRAQHPDSTILWDANLDCRYAKVIPDLLVESMKFPGRFLPMDAKYKLYDEKKKLDQSDIYQTFLYAHAYGDKRSILPAVLLLYPASSVASKPDRVHVRRAATPTAELRAVPIHIPTALQEARSKHADGIVKIIREAGGFGLT